MTPIETALARLHEHWQRLAAQMADPSIIGGPAYQQVLREHARLSRLMVSWRRVSVWPRPP